MRRHFLTTFVALLGWAFLAPASWMSLSRAQTPVNVTVPVNQNGTLSSASYQGSAASTSGDIGSFAGHYQDWYAVTLTAGQNYVISLWTSTDSFLSLQFSGAEVANNDDAGQPWLGAWTASQIIYTPTTTGTYTVVVSTYGQGTAETYTLTIPNPMPTAAPITLPYSGAVNLSNSSYYGAADSSMGSPPPNNPTGTGWYDYFQNWYSTTMTAGNGYYISLSGGSGSPIISIQNSSGIQVAYNQGSAGSAAINFPCSTTDTYTIICSQADATGPSNTVFTLSAQQLVPGSTLTSVSAPPTSSNNPTSTVNVTVTGLVPGAGAPTGSVTVTVGSFTSAPVPVTPGANATSTATVTVNTPVGSATYYTMTANFIGTGIFKNSSGSGSMTVLQFITVSSLPYSNNGNLTSSSFNGNVADGTLMGAGWSNGYYQDWYNVSLVAGQTYVFTMWDPTYGWGNSAMSLQNPSGTQVTYSQGGSEFWGLLSQFFYTPSASGTYTLVVTNGNSWGQAQTYTLTINDPTNANGKINIASLASAFSNSGTLSASSFYGAAASNMGSPPVLIPGQFGAPGTSFEAGVLWGQNYSTSQSPPPWVMYYQTWYTTSAMTVSTTYAATMTISTPGAGNAVLSIQNSSGSQVAFAYTINQNTATIYFTPTVADTYTIICTQDLIGVPGAPNPIFLMKNPPSASYTFSVQAVPAGTTATTVSATSQTTSNSSETVTVTVLGVVPSGGAPTGNVTVTIGSFTSAPVPVTPGSGTTSTATVTVTTPTVSGTYTVTANFTGTGIFLPSSGTTTMGVVNIIALTMPVNVSGSLSSASFSGIMADTSQMTTTTAPFGNFWNGGGPITNASALGCYQDWYSISLVQGQTYVITAWANMTEGACIISIQDKTGAQLNWSVIGPSGWPGMGSYGPSPQVVFVPPATDTYTIIVANVKVGTSMTYTLTIPNPAPPTPPAVNLPFSTTGTFTTSSYYGAGTVSSAGAPPPFQIGFPQINLPTWVDYFQNWYAVPMAAGEATTITMTMSANNPMSWAFPIISIQSSSGSQVSYTYNQGNSTATVNFTPTTSDTYYIICSQDQAGPGNSYSLTVTGPSGAVATKTTIFPGIDLPPNNLNVTVTVTAVGGPPTGTVTLSVDGGPGVTQTLANGSTVFNMPNPGPGNHTLTASYSGALPQFLPSQSSAPLLTGIPNTRFAPPAGNDADRRVEALLALALPCEPVFCSVETPVMRYWAARNDCAF